MLSDFRSLRRCVSAGLFGIMTLAAVFFVAGCSTNSSMAVSLSTGATQAVDQGQAVSITATGRERLRCQGCHMGSDERSGRAQQHIHNRGNL